ncbi:MAG: acetylglutamate kinase [Alphaproteobacteria bacterium]|jgi:acetylglutamate kinase|nr:acetylglutamate kinase [Alphaproteobacteria bacterium]PPR14705.1 MAG: Acetylglutamate kinase [Alphaproteobacteria bacterium MarineAlpha12_Bin1]|tara:strand:- start:1553 stop:2464 length:912 start_codon:yes stop_codon:yes gene_type:complete
MTKKTTPPNSDMINTASVLSEALPFMRRHSGRTFVIKYGGHAMGDSKLAELFARDVVLLKQVGINPVVVHGGGPQIGAMLERLKIKSEFINGLRVTDSETVEIVEMVLSGSINKAIAAAINSGGGRAVGISGKDGNLIRATKIKGNQNNSDSNIEKVLDLGFVGEPTKVEPSLLNDLIRADLIPVIAPLALGDDGETYNVNADTAAGAIAESLQAARLYMLTDVPGVLNEKGKIIPDISINEAKALIQDGTITGGMIPKVETCIRAVQNQVEASVILDGRIKHSLLLEIFTEHGTGTAIWHDK